MADFNIDFEGTGVQENPTQPVDNASTNNNVVNQQEEVTNLGGNDTADISNNVTSENNVEQPNPSTGELEQGTVVEYDGANYTVDANGNLVDNKGNVFKETKDVAEWLKSVEVEEENETKALDIASIQEALGVTITDENGNDIEFTNDVEGVKSYVDSVIALRSNELQEAAVNRLYSENPLLKQFQDYVQLTGSPRGFGDIPDRSGIHLDKDNDAQLIAVIKMAAQEFGNKSLTDSYINYLKDSGSLYQEAKLQLDALVEKDVQYRKDIEAQAQQQRDEEAKSVAEYWNNISKIVESRKIGDYRIPESFTKEVNGKKTIITPKDFYNYVSVPKETEDGRRMTAYQMDLAKLTDEQYMNREMLDAWLMFTGGTYKDLIDMAVKEEEVRRLRVKSKEQRSTKAVKIIKSKPSKTSIDDIIL